MTHHDKARELAGRGVLWLRGIDMHDEADAITALAEENRRLRGVLEKIASTGRCEFAEVRAVLRSTEASHD